MPMDKKEVIKNNRSIRRSRLAILRTDRTWLMAGVAGMLILSLYNTHQANQAVESSKNSHEVVWVKMWADGSTTVQPFNPEDEQPIYIRAINAGLNAFITSRFQVHPETVKQDYAEAGVFMGDALFTEFTDQNAFNAAQKASDIAGNPDKQDRVDISNIKLDHYDQISGDFSGEKKPIIRTTITWDETKYRPGGQLSKNDTTTRMMRITWTVMDRKAISEKSTSWLNINPLGLVILSKQELDR